MFGRGSFSAPRAAHGAATMQGNLDLSSAMIHPAGNDTLRIDGLRYQGANYDLNLKINLDGTWSL